MISTGISIAEVSVWAHLHNFILQLGQKPVDNLVLLDGERVQVDLFHALNLSSLDETAQLGDWLPFLLIRFRTTARASSPTATITSTSVTTAPVTETTTSTRSVSHIVGLCAKTGLTELRWCRC